MSLIHQPFNSQSETTILCPKCERSLDGHSEADCARKMSRRYFFGLGAAAAAIALGLAPKLPRLTEESWATIKAREIVLGVGDRLSINFTRTTLTNHNALISVLLKREDGAKRVSMLPVPAFGEQSVFVADASYRIESIAMVASGENIVRRPAFQVVRG